MFITTGDMDHDSVMGLEGVVRTLMDSKLFGFMVHIEFLLYPKAHLCVSVSTPQIFNNPSQRGARPRGFGTQTF